MTLRKLFQVALLSCVIGALGGTVLGVAVLEAARGDWIAGFRGIGGLTLIAAAFMMVAVCDP